MPETKIVLQSASRNESNQ